MPDAEKKKLSRYIDLIMREILLPFLLVILGIVIFDPIKDWWLGPKNYKIYLVGRTSPEIDRIFRGVRLGSSVEPLQVDDVPVVLETIDDQSNAAATAKYVADKDDALLVIGHVYSQRTIEALPTYMGVSPPIPVIATKETSRDLLNPEMQQNCVKKTFGCPVLQLSPTNDVQAVDALSFALNQVKKRKTLAKQQDHYDFLILKQSGGMNNNGYINDLADKFEDLLQGEFSKKRAFHRGTINVGDAGTFSNVVSAVTGLKPDAIIYVGQSPLARQFFSYYRDQIAGSQPADPSKGPSGAQHANANDPPLIILCDAAVSPDLASKGFMDISNVFAMYPISFSEYSQSDSVLGRDSYTVISALVKVAGFHRPLALPENWGYGVRRILQMHRVRDARAALALAFQDAFKEAKTFTGPTGNDYMFEFPYHRKNGQFHVWAITSKGVIEADGKDGDAVYSAQVVPRDVAPGRHSHKEVTYAARAETDVIRVK